MRFGQKLQSAMGTPYIGNVRDAIAQSITLSQFANKQNTALAISMESIDEAQKVALGSAVDQLFHSLESLTGSLNGMQDANGQPLQFTTAQLEAGANAGIIAGDPLSFLKMPLRPAVESLGTNIVAMNPAFAGTFERDAAALEAYNENNNRDAAMFAILFNMQASRQDDFGETLFPTITVSPDQAGIGITTTLLLIYQAVERRLSADVTDFAKRNIVRAIVDHTILLKDANRAVPVYRTQNAAKFVDQATVAARDIVIDNEPVKTGPIKFNMDLDYIALSATDAMLGNSVLNQTDTLEAAIDLTRIFVKVGNDVLRFDTLNLPGSNFTFMPQSNYREMQVAFDTTSLVLTKDSKAADGSALDTLKGIVTDDLSVRLRAIVNGRINIETGQLRLTFGGIEVSSVRKDGEEVPLTGVAVAPIVAAVAGGTGLGFELNAFHSNANRRMRGQLVDPTRYTQFYNVPLRAPVTAMHPAHATGIEDSSDVEILLALTRTRLMNESVSALLDAFETLDQYVDSRDPAGVGPDVLGVSRFFVRPTCFKEAIDCTKLVQSLDSTSLIEDLMNGIVNKVRDYAYRMYRDSEYKPASDILSGGLAPAPTVIIATDPVIAQYLMVNGDMRTLGPNLKHKVVYSYDDRMKGKLFITFGVFDENRNSAPNILNFGNLLWAPELVLTGNMARDNTLSKEATVTPRYRFIVHLPVMTELTISNIPEVMDKLPLAVVQV